MRLQDWQNRFAALVHQRQLTPFAWGAHDCVLWAADCVQALTGVDHAQAWRGSYSTALQAARVLSPMGGLVGVATAALGAHVSPLMAAVGDVVLVDNADREMLGVCIGTGVLAPGESGLVCVPMTAAIAVWKL